MIEVRPEELEQNYEEEFKEKMTPEKANEIMRKMRFVKAQIKQQKAIADNEKKRIDNWLAKELEEWEGREKHYEFLLIDWIKEEHAKNPKFKFSSPYGKSSIRNNKAWLWDDEKAMKFIKDHAFDDGNELYDLIKVEESLKKNDLKKRKDLFDIKDNKLIYMKTGELVDGVKIYDEVSYTVKVEDDQ